MFGISSLRGSLEELLVDDLTDRTAEEYLEVAEVYSCPKLKEACLKFL